MISLRDIVEVRENPVYLPSRSRHSEPKEKTKPHFELYFAPLDLLPNTRQQQPLKITARLPLYPFREVLAVLMRVRSAHVVHGTAVPVEPDDARCEELLARPRARHARLDECRRVHVLVDGVAELEKEGVLHVAREFLHCVSVTGLV